MHDQVIFFINKFKAMYPKEIQDAFLYGNCFWFAQILKQRFDGSVYYLQINNHFITKIDTRYYDISGEVVNCAEKQDLISWQEYCLTEPRCASRVYRNCVMLLDE